MHIQIIKGDGPVKLVFGCQPAPDLYKQVQRGLVSIASRFSLYSIEWMPACSCDLYKQVQSLNRAFIGR
jgi:hypothetical protein